MKWGFGALASIMLLGGCVTDSEPQYSLATGERDLHFGARATPKVS